MTAPERLRVMVAVIVEGCGLKVLKLSFECGRESEWIRMSAERRNGRRMHCAIHTDGKETAPRGKE